LFKDIKMIGIAWIGGVTWDSMNRFMNLTKGVEGACT